MSVVSLPRVSKTPVGLTFSSPLPSPTVSTEVESIFVQNSSEEVRKVEEKLRFDIERKKDHLRSIVGERYRDLIDSADLITQLSQTSKQILNEVSVLKTRLGDVSKSLNTEPASGNDTTNQLSIETYARLLLVLPEEIYNSIDACQPVDAALLYLLAGDICAHLQLSNYSTLVDSTQAQVRLARCRTSLAATCRNRLGAFLMPTKPGISAADTETITKAIGWLTAIVANDYFSPIQSYEGFLKCRLDRLNFIVAQNASQTAVSEAVHSYLSTALLTTQLFVDNHCGVFEQIEQRAAKICPAALTIEKEFITYTLPPGINNQLNKIVQHLAESCQLNSTEGLDTALVYNRLADWLKSAGKFLAVEIPKMLEKCCTMEALQSVCEETGNILSSCCCQNHVPSAGDIWSGFLAEAVVNRFEVLIRDHFDSIKKELFDLLINQASDSPPLIWSSAKANAFSTLAKQARLETTNYGRSSSDLFVVGHFTGQQYSVGLQLAMASIDSLLARCKGFVATGLPLDHREIGLMKMRQEASAFGTSIVELCKKELTQEKQSNRCLNLSSFSFAVAFLFNYVEDWLSNPNFSLAGKAALPGKMLLSDSVFWSDCRSQISALCVEAFQYAMDTFIFAEVNNRFMKGLEASVNCNESSKRKFVREMTWMSVEIEEESDSGQKVISKISVPQQPSFNVYSLLSSLCRFASQSSPAFLMKQNSLNITVFGCVARVYAQFISSLKATEPADELSDPVFSVMDQDCAIQHMFDFQLLIALLIGDHRRSQQFASASIDTLHAFESFVDPFDLNTFQPHLTEAVRKYAKGVQSIFGLVAGAEIASYRAGKVAQPISAQSEDHNVLRLSQRQGRISALSIPFSQAQLYPV